jgi:flavin reductase (DIM6/NTAB) family NADH-FMN oxidoreductase RutF
MPSTRVAQLPVLYFGTPVALLTTLNDDGSSNITPISSAWALDDRYVLGLGSDGQALHNLRRVPELVINLPSAEQVHAVEAIAPTTGRWPVPESKAPHYRHSSDKWALGGFTPRTSDAVLPLRIDECPVQLEARVVQMVPIADAAAVSVEAQVIRTHVHDDILREGAPDRIDVSRWHPLYYVFRHYFAQGAHVGTNARASLLDVPGVNA